MLYEVITTGLVAAQQHEFGLQPGIQRQPLFGQPCHLRRQHVARVEDMFGVIDQSGAEQRGIARNPRSYNFV